MEALKIDRVPEGWKVIRGAQTAPIGWVWVCNGKSRFGGEYEHALVPESAAREWLRRQSR